MLMSSPCERIIRRGSGANRFRFSEGFDARQYQAERAVKETVLTRPSFASVSSASRNRHCPPPETQPVRDDMILVGRAMPVFEADDRGGEGLVVSTISLTALSA